MERIGLSTNRVKQLPNRIELATNRLTTLTLIL